MARTLYSATYFAFGHALVATADNFPELTPLPISIHNSIKSISLPCTTVTMPAPPPPEKPTFLAQLLAGASAGLLSDALMHPVNTVQTNRQSNLPTPRARLYRGFSVVALFSAPAHALYFSVYDNLRETSPAAAGLAAELSGTLLLTPSEVLKKRAQVGAVGYAAPLGHLLTAVARDVRRAPGPTVRDLYAGAVLSSAVWLPFSVIYFDS